MCVYVFYVWDLCWLSVCVYVWYVICICMFCIYTHTHRCICSMCCVCVHCVCVVCCVFAVRMYILCALKMNAPDLWWRNRCDRRKGSLEMNEPHREDAWWSLSLRIGGRDGDRERGWSRQGWRLATLPLKCLCPVLGSLLSCANSVLNACELIIVN